MSTIGAPRGTADVLPSESGLWQAVEATARHVAALYGFGEIRTPVFEHTELFHRGVGETSDLVHKETYTFEDRGGRSLTLRPEGTAGVVRAAIENNLVADPGARLKVYYIGANFRFERPQAGRTRIHHQFGAEAFGSDQPEQDVECILLQLDFYKRCGLKDLSLKINSLGDSQSKSAYRDALVAHLTPKQDQFSDDSKRRLMENPLRILDSKDPRDEAACADAPPAVNSLSEKSAAHLKRVQALLTEAAVPFQLDGRLVRGFDYYTETLWEVTTAGLGAQNAVGGGGRYDNLVQLLGGRPTPAVGFGSGIERLLLALKAQSAAPPAKGTGLVWLAYHGDAAKAACFKLLAQLRQADIRCDCDFSNRSMKAQFKLADRNAAAICLVIGDTELQNNSVMSKNLASGAQAPVAMSDLLPHLRGQLAAI